MLWYFGCADWHGTSSSVWPSDSGYGFRRGATGVYSFSGTNIWKEHKNCGRGVAVVKSAVRAERVTDDLCDEAECSVRHRTLI